MGVKRTKLGFKANIELVEFPSGDLVLVEDTGLGLEPMDNEEFTDDDTRFLVKKHKLDSLEVA